MAGLCDERQTFCFALALWNGDDPILKERMFGLAGAGGQPRRGRQGVLVVPRLHADPLVDALALPLPAARRSPTTSWSRSTAAAAGTSPSTSWSTPASSTTTATGRSTSTTPRPPDRPVHADHGRATAGPEPATLHVLPTLWFRNTWAWGLPGRDHVPAASTATTRGDSAAPTQPTARGGWCWPARAHPEPLFCDNETNARRLWGVPGPLAVPEGRHQRPRRARCRHRQPGAGWAPRPRCTTCSTVPPGGSRRDPGAADPARPRVARRRRRRTWAPTSTAVMAARRAEADAFFAPLHPGRRPPDEALVLRQAVAGLLWGKQFYHFDVARWLDGDPAGPPPPPGRRHGRNAHWWHMNSFDVISMPDPWEYPWYAAWDLAFHCVADRPGRPRLRQGAAAAAAARVVHAPQRPDPGVRVGVRRRQPAGARLGRAAGVRTRRLAATSTSSPACCTSCC